MVEDNLTRYQESILSSLNKKGWNAYNSTRNPSPETTIPLGPATELKIEERYVLLPISQDPRDPQKVMAELEKLAIRLNRETPTIEIKGRKFPWTGFIPKNEHVKVNTICGHFIPYEEFITALDTIVQV